MKEMNIFSYISKYRNWIIILSLFAGVLFYTFFSNRQTYTAKAIIQYNNEEAVKGLAADGIEIDTSEIYSSEVMTRVFQKLGYNYNEKNMDEIRSNVHVEPILTEEKETVQTALNENGEELKEKPTMYMVSYTVNKNEVEDAERFASTILSTILDEYMEVYAENHVNRAVQPDSVSGIYDQDYDYIEMVEIVEDSVSNAIERLSYITVSEFRSAETGYSFYDINEELNLINSIDISNAYSYILDNKITKDQEVLLAKYENRINNAQLSNDASQSEVDGIQKIINTYLSIMKNSGNSNFTSNYILQEVYDRYYSVYSENKMDLSTEEDNQPNESSTHEEADVTTEYDVLMNDYADNQMEFEHAIIDAAHYAYIMNVFSGGELNNDQNTPSITAVEGEKGISLKTEIELIDEIVTPQKDLNTTYDMIKKITDKISDLYNILQITNKEYNEYLGAQNIAVLTDTVVNQGINLKLYTVLAVVLFGLAGCGVAIVIGRLFEIFDYYLFMDKKLSIANRAGCDRYISNYKKEKKKNGMTCVAIRLSGIQDKNLRFGREQCDQMIKDFCEILRSKFGADGCFIAVNGLGQYIVFIDSDDKQYAHSCMREVNGSCVEYNIAKACKIAYSCGISSSSEEKIYDPRKLMIRSMAKAEGKIGNIAS